MISFPFLRSIKRKAVGGNNNASSSGAGPSTSTGGEGSSKAHMGGGRSATNTPAIKTDPSEEPSDATKLAHALDKIRRLQEKQEAWDSKLEEMRRVNEEQYRDLEGMRASHFKPQQVNLWVSIVVED